MQINVRFEGGKRETVFTASQKRRLENALELAEALVASGDERGRALKVAVDPLLGVVAKPEAKTE